MCGKRTYPSEHQAKRAHQRASWRLRVYYCDDCHGYHVTNQEKRGGYEPEFDPAAEISTCRYLSR
jgi:hypothetical protein